MTPKPKRKLGRPKKAPADRLITAHLCLPMATYDAVCRIANRRGLSVSSVLRRIVEGRLEGLGQPALYDKVPKGIWGPPPAPPKGLPS